MSYIEKAYFVFDVLCICMCIASSVQSNGRGELIQLKCPKFHSCIVTNVISRVIQMSYKSDFNEFLDKVGG